MQPKCLPLSLTLSLKGPGKSLSWSPVMDSAFTRAKDLLSFVPELIHPQPDAPISLTVDASDTHLGTVLQQLLDGSGLCWFSTPRSSLKPRRNTLPLTVSSWLPILLSVIFGSYLKVEILLFSPITSLSPMLCLESLQTGPSVSNATSPTWPSSPVPWFTFLAQRML